MYLAAFDNPPRRRPATFQERWAGFGRGMLYFSTAAVSSVAALGYAFLVLQEPSGYTVQTALRDAEPVGLYQNASLEPTGAPPAARPPKASPRAASGSPSKAAEDDGVVQVPISPIRSPATAPSAAGGRQMADAGNPSAGTAEPGSLDSITPDAGAMASKEPATDRASPSAAPAAPVPAKPAAAKTEPAKPAASKPAPSASAPAKPANPAADAPKPHQVAQRSTADILGPYRIQVGTFRTPEAAQSQWFQLQRQHRDLIGRLVMVIERVNLGHRGIVYRLQGGPVKSRQSVLRMCERLSRRRVSCTHVEG